MSVIDTAKSVRDLVGKLDNFDLLQKAVDLQSQVADLVAKNLELREKITSLEARLKIQDDLTFRDNHYYLGNDGPYCQVCWDIDGKLVRELTKGYDEPWCRYCLNMRSHSSRT